MTPRKACCHRASHFESPILARIEAWRAQREDRIINERIHTAMVIAASKRLSQLEIERHAILNPIVTMRDPSVKDDLAPGPITDTAMHLIIVGMLALVTFAALGLAYLTGLVTP